MKNYIVTITILLVYFSISNSDTQIGITKSITKNIGCMNYISGNSQSYAIVKFVEGANIRIRNSMLKSENDISLSSFEEITKKYESTRLSRLFKSSSEEELDQFRKSAELRSGKTLKDLNLYYQVFLKNEYNLQSLVEELNTFPIIENAYIPGKISFPSADYSAGQEYIYNTPPVGLGIEHAWQYNHGKGQGVGLIDVEGGWNLNHEDLPTNIQILWGYQGTSYEKDENHGTSVLGILTGLHNGFGVNGICPEADIDVVSVYEYEGVETPYFRDAIIQARNHLNPGDIMLLEVQLIVEFPSGDPDNPEYINLPVEYDNDCYDVINQAVAGGIIVVEAAGNNAANLDDEKFGGKFTTKPNSGAIMVAGNNKSNNGESLGRSNFGSRIDVNGWGEGIVTTGDAFGTEEYQEEHDLPYPEASNKNQRYHNDFGGSSGASAMVAGAVACIQGYHKYLKEQNLEPNQMKELLVNTGNTGNTGFGVRPDLEKIFLEITVNQEVAPQVSRWDNGWDDPVDVPLHFDSFYDFTEVLRADQEIHSGKKYHDWNLNLTDVKNHHKFLMDNTQVDLTAHFKEIALNIILKTELLSGGSGGYLKFMDPWYIHYNEPPYGFRNNGMDAPLPFESVGSYLDFSESSAYQGVFLNENPDFNPINPIYSVYAPQNQQINSHNQERNWYFQGWDGDNVNFEDESSETTKLVFQQNGSEIRAVYKGHLASGTLDAYNSNSQRKIVRTESGDYYHTIYLDDYYDQETHQIYQNIYYSRSPYDNFNDPWIADELVLRSGEFAYNLPLTKDYFDDAVNPSLDYHYDDLFLVTEAIFDDEEYLLYMDYYGLEEVPNSSMNYYGYNKPAIAVTDELVFIAWKDNNPSQTLKYSIFDRGSRQWLVQNGSIPNSSSTSYNVTLAADKVNDGYNYVHMAWQVGSGSIKYQKYRNINGTVQWSGYSTISSGSGMDKHDYPSITLHHRSGSQLDPVVTWKGSIRNQNWEYYAFTRACNSGVWGAFQQNGNKYVQYSNINSSDDGYSIAAFNVSNGNHYYVKYNGSIYTSGSLSSTGQEIQICNSADLGGIKSISILKSAGLPYLLQKTTDNFGGLTKVIALGDYSTERQGVVVKNDVEFVFKIGEVEVNDQNITFKDFPDIEKINTTSTLNSLVRTEDMLLEPYPSGKVHLA